MYARGERDGPSGRHRRTRVSRGSNRAVPSSPRKSWRSAPFSHATTARAAGSHSTSLKCACAVCHAGSRSAHWSGPAAEPLRSRSKGTARSGCHAPSSCRREWRATRRQWCVACGVRCSVGNKEAIVLKRTSASPMTATTWDWFEHVCCAMNSMVPSCRFKWWRT